MAPHHLQHEAALVAVRGRDDRVGHLEDAVQRRVRAYRHVRAAEVVIDGPDHAHDVQLRVPGRHLLADAAAGHQLLDTGQNVVRFQQILTLVRSH